MKINSSFSVAAPPDQVFAYLLDVNQVVGCVPGAELGEVVDASTFSGKLKVKVGAVQITIRAPPISSTPRSSKTGSSCGSTPRAMRSAAQGAGVRPSVAMTVGPHRQRAAPRSASTPT